jgi:hypothetical protein
MGHGTRKPHECSEPPVKVTDPQADLRRLFVAAVAAYERQVGRLTRQGIDAHSALQAVPPIDLGQLTNLRCGATGKRTGRPYPQTGLYSNGRCRWHGGLSTGPRTAAGKARSAQNARKNKPHERDIKQVSSPPQKSVEEGGAEFDRNLALSYVPRDSTQWLVLEWLTRRAWRPSPEAQLSQALSLAPTKLRWVLQCLKRRGFAMDVRGADGDTVAWQVLRNRL